MKVRVRAQDETESPRPNRVSVALVLVAAIAAVVGAVVLALLPIWAASEVIRVTWRASPPVAIGGPATLMMVIVLVGAFWARRRILAARGSPLHVPSPDDESALWDVVRISAVRAQSRVPERLELEVEPTVAREGRVLRLGAPLLVALTKDELSDLLAAVLAAEPLTTRAARWSRGLLMPFGVRPVGPADPLYSLTRPIESALALPWRLDPARRRALHRATHLWTRFRETELQPAWKAGHPVQGVLECFRQFVEAADQRSVDIAGGRPIEASVELDRRVTDALQRGLTLHRAALQPSNLAAVVHPLHRRARFQTGLTELALRLGTGRAPLRRLLARLKAPSASGRPAAIETARFLWSTLPFDVARSAGRTVVNRGVTRYERRCSTPATMSILGRNEPVRGSELVDAQSGRVDAKALEKLEALLTDIVVGAMAERFAFNSAIGQRLRFGGGREARAPLPELLHDPEASVALAMSTDRFVELERALDAVDLLDLLPPSGVALGRWPGLRTPAVVSAARRCYFCRERAPLVDGRPVPAGPAHLRVSASSDIFGCARCGAQSVHRSAGQRAAAFGLAVLPALAVLVGIGAWLGHDGFSVLQGPAVAFIVPISLGALRLLRAGLERAVGERLADAARPQEVW